MDNNKPINCSADRCERGTDMLLKEESVMRGPQSRPDAGGCGQPGDPYLEETRPQSYKCPFSSATLHKQFEGLAYQPYF